VRKRAQSDKKKREDGGVAHGEQEGGVLIGKSESLKVCEVRLKALMVLDNN
jgi:hypothetical protein